MTDFTKLDPNLLYELGRQLSEAFPAMVTLDVIHQEWGEISFWWTTRVGPASDEESYIFGSDPDIIEALRKLAIKVAAAEENKEAAND